MTTVRSKTSVRGTETTSPRSRSTTDRATPACERSEEPRILSYLASARMHSTGLRSGARTERRDASSSRNKSTGVHVVARFERRRSTMERGQRILPRLRPFEGQNESTLPDRNSTEDQNESTLPDRNSTRDDTRVTSSRCLSTDDGNRSRFSRAHPSLARMQRILAHSYTISGRPRETLVRLHATLDPSRGTFPREGRFGSAVNLRARASDEIALACRGLPPTSKKPRAASSRG